MLKPLRRNPERSFPLVLVPSRGSSGAKGRGVLARVERLVRGVGREEGGGPGAYGYHLHTETVSLAYAPSAPPGVYSWP